MGKTRNYGIKHSTGELITFIDSDDYIQPEAYSNMIDRLNKTNADVVYCGFRYVYENREKTDVFDCKELYTNIAELMEYILNEHRCFAGLSACTGIYKRSIIEKISDGPFLSEREFLSEDKLFNIIYLQNANAAAIINASYYYYVQHSVGSITTTFKEYKIQAAYNMCQKMLEINKVSELIPFILTDYLVNLSACFHQICADDALDIKKELSEISLIVNNKDYQGCLKNVNNQMLSAKFRLVYWMIRLKMEGGIYLLYSANCLMKNWKKS